MWSAASCSLHDGASETAATYLGHELGEPNTPAEHARDAYGPEELLMPRVSVLNFIHNSDSDSKAESLKGILAVCALMKQTTRTGRS